MRWFSFIIIVLIATLLETGNLLNLLVVGGWIIRPGILITLLVYYALTCRSHEAISCSFLIGLAADLSAGLLGPHMLCYGLMGVLLNSVSHTLTMRRATHKAMFVFLAFLITEIGAYWLSILKTHESRPNIYSVLFFTGLYSAIISPLVWSVLSSLSGWSKTKHPKTQRIYH
ncbi:MAG: rod shape-determining protein MreD [Phycisphaerae bacterium]|nr:rod shape-determining protein MreD [Phycisphaerae bacterium]